MYKTLRFLHLSFYQYIDSEAPADEREMLQEREKKWELVMSVLSELVTQWAEGEIES